MSYAVAKPQASSPAGHDDPPSTATVYDFTCLFTHDLRRKQKRWQDGKLKYHSFNKKVMVYDDRGHFVGDAHWDQEGDLATGDELSLDRGMALVQVDECTGEKQQDLTELLDKRAREVEKRRQIAAAKTRPAPRSSTAAGGAQPQPQPQRPHLSLSALVQSPGRIGRAAIPNHSPFEARQYKLHQNQPPAGDTQPIVPERAPPAAKRRRTSPSPPSKAGHARSLFGATLSLSSCPGPELLAARARALRMRTQSQIQALSTPQDDEDKEQEPVQSSPLFVQNEAESTLSKPSKPSKEQRSTLQPVTRHPIASARAVMREADEAGNRDVDMVTNGREPDEQENAPKKRREEARKPQRQAEYMDNGVQDLDVEEEPIISAKPPKKKKDKEPKQIRNLQPVEDQQPEKREKTTAAPLRSPSPIPIAVDDESDAVEEAPRPGKTPKEQQQRKKKRNKEREPLREELRDELREELREEPAPKQAAPKPKEPRTTLRMRSRQKRGLLMMREPVIPQPEPEPEPEPPTVIEDFDDRIASTPSPERTALPDNIRSPSPPEEVVIPSSAPPEKNTPAPALSERIPTPPPPELSSDDDLPQPSKRRAKKRRTYSPSPEPEIVEKAPKKKKLRKAAKRRADEDEPSQEEDEPQPRKRRAAKRATYEDPESDAEQHEEEEIPEVKGPRIAKLPRKGIRSREIIGYVAQGIETLIPGPFASGAFRLGGPPVPVPVVSERPAEPMVEAAPEPANEPPKLSIASPIEAALVVSSPIEGKPVASSPVALDEPDLEDFTLKELVAEEPLLEPAIAEPAPEAQPETTSVVRQNNPEPLPPQTIAVAAEPEEIRPVASRRKIVLEPPTPVVRSNSSNDAIAATTAEANDTKLEALSAPEIPLANVPEKITASLIDTKPDLLLVTPVPVPETTSSSDANQAGRPRIANPASRGKKAARREDAAGLAPQVIVPFEPPVQPLARIATRPAGGSRSRIATAGPLAIIAGAVSTPAPRRQVVTAPVAAKKAVNMPGFTSASGGTWSRHAHDLLGMGRPER